MQNKVIIIAEAGVNHNGNIATAYALIDAAAEAGADYVKFQTFKAENLVTENAKQAQYQVANIGKESSQFEMLKALELDFDAHQKLIEYCKTKPIGFLSSAFDLESIDVLAGFKLDYWKIPSGEITNLPYLQKIGSYGQKVLLSTGMANLGEIENALKILTLAGTQSDQITVLHANTEYPTPMHDVNLFAMQTIGAAFKLKFGYSDHSLGIEVPIAAVALGASVIEKHLTLNNQMPGPDHKSSLEPQVFKYMVSAIRNIELALGSGIKQASESEKKNMVAARKSIVAKTFIKKGELFSEKNLTIKRPGKGISPMKWHEIIGTEAMRNYRPDELIEL